MCTASDINCSVSVQIHTIVHTKVIQQLQLFTQRSYNSYNCSHKGHTTVTIVHTKVIQQLQLFTQRSYNSYNCSHNCYCCMTFIDAGIMNLSKNPLSECHMLTLDIVVDEDNLEEGALTILKFIRPQWVPVDVTFKVMFIALFIITV